jgi:hypothetical protein
LEELDVDWRDSRLDDRFLSFKGEGSTPPERRASMQRQLEALCSSTAFMAPDSWPACNCLVSFSMREFDDLNGDSYLAAATRTPSLACLDIGTRRMDFAAIGDQDLTSEDLDPGPLEPEVLAAIGQLSSLQQLHIYNKLLPYDDSGNSIIPASWSGLSSLTQSHAWR